MELKYSIALYACAGVALAFLIFSFIRFRRKRKFKGGTKAAEASYISEIPHFKRRLIAYKILKFILTVSIIVNLLLSGFLMAITMSLEDFVITFFVSGPGSTTLPLYVYSMIRFGVSPVINSLSVVMILITCIIAFLCRKGLKGFAAGH